MQFLPAAAVSKTGNKAIPGTRRFEDLPEISGIIPFAASRLSGGKLLPVETCRQAPVYSTTSIHSPFLSARTELSYMASQ